MSAELKNKVCDIIDDMAGELVEASRAIHAKPEVAFEEKFAHGLLTDKVHVEIEAELLKTSGVT